MTRRSVFLVHCFFIALANNALSETLFVQIFLDQAPLSGITLMVDGDEVGRRMTEFFQSILSPAGMKSSSLMMTLPFLLT